MNFLLCLIDNNLIVLDEPMINFDLKMREEFLKIILILKLKK